MADSTGLLLVFGVATALVVGSAVHGSLSRRDPRLPVGTRVRLRVDVVDVNDATGRRFLAARRGQLGTIADRPAGANWPRVRLDSGHTVIVDMEDGEVEVLPEVGSANEEDALREGFSILSEYPDRVATSYRSVMSTRGKRAKAGAFLAEGGRATARSLVLDNARIARALLKKGT